MYYINLFIVNPTLEFYKNICFPVLGHMAGMAGALHAAETSGTPGIRAGVPALTGALGTPGIHAGIPALMLLGLQAFVQEFQH